MANKKRGKQAVKRSCSCSCKQKAHQHVADRPKSITGKLLFGATATLLSILPHIKNGSEAILAVRDLYLAFFN
ncbi:hypothetical protein CF126_08860 [Aeromonas dhakensis]|nr:hypothetical protein CF126_08860 [Aeromonas dhakensis]